MLAQRLNEQEKKLSPEIVTFKDLWIRPKEGEALLNLGDALNFTQKKFINERLQINPFEKFTLRSRRYIKLKARQLGFTTLTAALFFCDTVNHKLRYTVIMAHDDATTRKIFEIVKRFYDNLPPEKKPHTKYNTKTDLTFDELDSQFYVGTAGSKSFGQGTTVNNVLGSEVASWPNPKDILANLMQAVPKTGNVFLESTAEGIGNFFHTEWEAAENDDSVYEPDFSPWFEEPEYRLPIPEDFTPTEKEVKLAQLYSVDFEQLTWYRSKEKELRELVSQEYPFCPEEAFLSSGGDYFPGEILKEYVETAKTLEVVKGWQPQLKDFPNIYREWISKRLSIQLWELPIPGAQYIITGDSSEGEEDVKTDFSSGDIVKIQGDEWTQVGHIHGKLEPHVLARIMVELGYFYNYALLLPERNNHGGTVCNEILHHTNYGKMDPHGWGGLYHHKEYDAANRQQTMKPGFPTNVKTKIIALDSLLQLVIERSIAISSLATLKEMINYKCLGKGKYGAPPGLHDDRVMSLAMAAYVLINRPRTVQKTQAVVRRVGEFA